MNRRNFLTAASAAPITALAAQSTPSPVGTASKLKITGVRLVNTRQRKRAPSYTPSAGSWSTQNVEVASPMSIYPEYKATRSLFFPDPGKMPGFTVEITHRQGHQRIRQRRRGRRHGGDGASVQAADERGSLQHRAQLGHLLALHHALRTHGHHNERHQRRRPRAVGHHRQGAGHAGVPADRRRGEAAHSGLLHRQRHRTARRVRVQAAETGDSVRSRRRPARA